MANQRARVDVPKGAIKDTVGVIVRIHAGRHSSDEIKASLRGMGLAKKYDAVFTKLDAECIKKLKPYDAYLAYGYVSMATVEQLLQRRAYTSAITGQRQTLSDNMTIEKLLGDLNILCVSDLVHELYSVGEHFDKAKAFLCTFKLASPVGGYEKEVLHVHDKVEEKGGFLSDTMDNFLAKIV